MSDDLDPRLRGIFARLFPVDPAALDDGARRGELDGWDSLAHVELVDALEREFSLCLEPERALEMETFGDVKKVLRELLSGG